jgi:hypothetical protein
MKKYFENDWYGWAAYNERFGATAAGSADLKGSA